MFLAPKIICSNPACGYQGRCKRKRRFSWPILILCLLFCIVPGIFYFLFRGGFTYYCPKCGKQVRSDA